MQQTQHWVDPELYAAGVEIEAGASAVSWGAIFAGGAVAIATSLILLTLGSGFGLASISPWPGLGPHAASFTIGAGVWLIVMQWLSSALGGYITGRLRTRWKSLHTDEVFFRDTAHGLLAWAVATIVVAALAVFGAGMAAGVGEQANVSMTTAAVDEARKAAAAFAVFGAISMLLGAFIACVSAAIGGRLRDKHP